MTGVEIAEAVNLIIEEMKQDRLKTPVDPTTHSAWLVDAVNWADLGCSEVLEESCIWTEADKYETIVAIIEEASPDAGYFISEVMKRFNDKYPGIDIEIRTEW